MFDGYKKIYISIFIFFIIFAFPILPFFSSAKIVMLYVLAIVLLKGSVKKYAFSFSYYFSNFSIVYYCVLFYTIFITVAWLAFDWSLTIRIVSSFILYVISFCLFRLAYPYVNIDKVVIYCFVVQSIFIILSIFSESFFTLMEPFRKVEESRELAYGRLRGNAICGYQFFGLSTMYTFVIIYMILHLNKFKYGLLSLVLLCIAGICSGRYCIVGVIIGVAGLLLKNILEGKINKVVGICLGLISIVCVSIALLYHYVDDISDPLMYEVVSEYLIDPLDSILVNGSFQSDSTDDLMAMYQKDDIKQYFILGAGKYEMENGGYFGGVDIGYYRMLGYYGIPGFLIIAYAIYYLIYKTKSDLDIFTKHAFFVNFLVLNIKGDVQVFSNNIIPIIVAFLFFSNIKTKYN